MFESSATVLAGVNNFLPVRVFNPYNLLCVLNMALGNLLIVLHVHGELHGELSNVRYLSIYV